jgi:hypothetical protein
LDCQLTSRCKNQNDRSVSGGEKWLSIDVDNGWETVGQCLSRSSLSNTNDIASRESHWPALGLDSGWGRETLGLDLAHNIGWKASLIEGLDRSWDVVTRDADIMLSPELCDFGLRPVSNSRILLVKRFFELGQSADV